VENLWINVSGYNHHEMSPGSNSLYSLLETLNLLLEQARAYERALPANDYRARAAVAALSRLAERARSEAASLSEQEKPETEQPDHPFSPREFQVLLLAMDGLTNKEIGFRLGISERTVQFHLNSIFNKTATSSRTEAVALALRKGWLTRSSGG
jgi:DNA-binding NarL/FixJ family response regulator